MSIPSLSFSLTYDVNDLSYLVKPSLDFNGHKIIKENSYNKVLLDSWVHDIYTTILKNEKQNYSITFWINIPEENKDKLLSSSHDPYGMTNNPYFAYPPDYYYDSEEDELEEDEWDEDEWDEDEDE